MCVVHPTRYFSDPSVQGHISARTNKKVKDDVLRLEGQHGGKEGLRSMVPNSGQMYVPRHRTKLRSETGDGTHPPPSAVNVEEAVLPAR